MVHMFLLILHMGMGRKLKPQGLVMLAVNHPIFTKISSGCPLRLDGPIKRIIEAEVMPSLVRLGGRASELRYR